jgi:cytochrome c biogenesis protein CcmG, thiol:disulfide interchange protein DsbE
MMRRLLTVLAVLLLVTGCGATTKSNPEPAAGASSAPAKSSRADLAAAKKRAGIDGCPTSSHQSPRPDGLPDVTLACLGGGPAVRLAGLRGKPMVINIWAQWCGPCRSEAPHLAAVAADAGDKVNFIGIDYGDPDPEAAIEFAQIVGWRYPQLQDRGERVKGPLKIIGVPQTFLVDADGKIVYRQLRPFSSKAQVRQAIRDHLGVML